MPPGHVLTADLATIWRQPDRKGFVRMIGWGDPVEVLSVTDRHVEVRIWDFEPQPDGSERPVPASGFIVPPRSPRTDPADLVVPLAGNTVLRVDFVDVQQGDGAMIQTPSGRVILVDGGDNQLFARYLAGQLRGTSDQRPFAPEAIVITHGDADHFSGLTEIRKSERHGTRWKRLFLAPKRVFHNGLVKRPTTHPDGRRRREIEMLGDVTELDGERIITDLADDIRTVPDTELNRPFKAWKETLEHWAARAPIEMKRVSRGDRPFDFLDDDAIDVEVLGPILSDVDGTPGLRFLGKPPPGPRLDVESMRSGATFTGTSASHTINGHSIILRLTYGDVRFLLTGDLNEEASGSLLAAAVGAPLTAEVFKAPHHGSADFDPRFLAAVSPVVSVVSSGDENALKEYIHPRATLVGALGRYSRVAEPLVFVTELVAFFETKGWTTPEIHAVGADKVPLMRNGLPVFLAGKRPPPYFGFSRKAFGLVRVRTDGHRLLVYTDSGQADLKEAYAYQVNAGVATPSAVRRA